MDVLQALKERRSCRAFLDKTVTPEQVTEILNAARFAPSGVNTQPWQVIALGPTTKSKLCQGIICQREAAIAPNPDYDYYPKEWFEPYKSRRKACGQALYGALGIGLEETEKRKIAWYRNYHFFGAPVGLLFMVEKKLALGSWLDSGMFIQSVMLAAQGLGLASCPQAAMVEYPDLIRALIPGLEPYALICGMAIGYADETAAVNRFRTERVGLETFFRFVE